MSRERVLELGEELTVLSEDEEIVRDNIGMLVDYQKCKWREVEFDGDAPSALYEARMALRRLKYRQSKVMAQYELAQVAA